MKPGAEHINMTFRHRPSGEDARLMSIRGDAVDMWRGGWNRYVVTLKDFDTEWDLVPPMELAARKTAVELRALLLALPYEVRMDALRSMDVCLHCGVDERRDDGTVPDVRCQCWNDE